MADVATGAPGSLYAILILVVLWIAVNLVLARARVRPPDPPPFYYLQGVAAVGSLLMTTIILTTQNRQTRHAEQRQQLDLQVNLLAEAKIAKLIGLIEELRRDLPSVPNRLDPVAEAMKQSVDPGQVLAALQRTMESATAVVVEELADGSRREREGPPEGAPSAPAGEAAPNPPPDEAPRPNRREPRANADAPDSVETNAASGGRGQ